MNIVIKAALATIIGLTALQMQGYTLPQKFVNGAVERGVPTVKARFIGLTWKCGDETCFSGLANHGGWFWHTGP